MFHIFNFCHCLGKPMLDSLLVMGIFSLRYIKGKLFMCFANFKFHIVPFSCERSKYARTAQCL